MNSDMLCSIVTEATYTHLDKLVDELHVILLESRILGIHVRKTAYALLSALCTIVIVIDTLKTLAVEHLLPASYSSIELVCNKIDVECSMVRKHIHKDTDTIFLRCFEHGLHLCFGTDDIVADGPVSRLIIVVPVSFLFVKDLHISSLRAETCVYR